MLCREVKSRKSRTQSSLPPALAARPQPPVPVAGHNGVGNSLFRLGAPEVQGSKVPEVEMSTVFHMSHFQLRVYCLHCDSDITTFFKSVVLSFSGFCGDFNNVG